MPVEMMVRRVRVVICRLIGFVLVLQRETSYTVIEVFETKICCNGLHVWAPPRFIW